MDGLKTERIGLGLAVCADGSTRPLTDAESAAYDKALITSLAQTLENAIIPEGHADISANARALVEEWLKSPIEVYLREQETKAEDVTRARARAELDEVVHQIAAERFGFKRFIQDSTVIHSGTMNRLVSRKTVELEAKNGAAYLSTPRVRP